MGPANDQAGGAGNDLERPFNEVPAIHDKDTTGGLGDPKKVYLAWKTVCKRNQTQLDALQPLRDLDADIIRVRLPGTDPLTQQCTLYAPSAEVKKIKTVGGERVFQKVLYLFNVIVALEWNPSVTTLQQIRVAARNASNFLYDVTDGCMAIGQVIIGGPKLMPGADIQVFASNRVHPRSWVDALKEADKFMPIRVGRGLWQKERSYLSTWDSPEGYRALMHEWGHYAFGLADEYLKEVYLRLRADDDRLWEKVTPVQSRVAIAAPDLGLAHETLMASAQISEFAPRKTTFQSIRDRYGSIPKRLVNAQPLEGPHELPIDVPWFVPVQQQRAGDENAARQAADEAIERAGKELLLGPEEDEWVKVKDILTRSGGSGGGGESHWLFVRRQEDAKYNLPRRLIAQGKIGRQDWTDRFRVLGARPGDELIAVSQVGARTTVQHLKFEKPDPRPALGEPDPSPPLPWIDGTPRDLALGNPVFIDVVPDVVGANPGDGPIARLRVRCEANTQPDQVWLYPAGEAEIELQRHGGWWFMHKAVRNLDGHVLLEWNGEPKRLLIVSYSQGGGPLTSGGGKNLPITGGSAEGNAMIFFHANALVEESLPEPIKQAAEDLRLVTTTSYVGQQVIEAFKEARSYTFTLATNGNLLDYPSTLVLNYDAGAPRWDSYLLIHRWDSNQGRWVALSTYAPDDLPYVAVPLDVQQDTAPGLYRHEPGDAEAEPAEAEPAEAEPFVDRYRVFLTPR